jgi:HEAT repeat protein
MLLQGVRMPEIHYKKLLSSSNEEKCTIALELAKMGKPAYQYMVQSLIHENEWVRMFMAEALGTIGDENVVPHLVPLLKDDDQMVRFIVAEALGNIGSKDAITPLETGMPVR